MSVLLTGGSGFIGKNLLVELGNRKTKVTLIGREHYKKHKTFICDFLKDKIPEIAFDNIETVIHLAGRAHDTKKKILSDLYFKLNTETVIDLAKISITKKVKNFIFISSVKAENPSDIYGVSKKKAEDELIKLSKNSNMKIIIIRPALVYGRQVKGNLKSMIRGIDTGWFPPLPETKNKKSMIHVDDLVSAILFLNGKNNLKGNLFTVTDGKFYSSAEIYNILCTVLGKKIPKWRVPKLFFDFISFFFPFIKTKIEKLLGNDFYNSYELESLGFKAKKTLYDINN